MTSSTDTAPPDFAALGLDPILVAAATALGYEEPTPIQREAIPLLLAGRDVLGQAATGTGKTAAFALPMLQRIHEDGAERGVTSGLVLVPTRELAMQVAEAIHKYAKGINLSVVPVYGGAPMDVQIRALKRGADIVVATPGRALDHMQRKTLKLDSVSFLALDEADEMLDMGFADDLEAILQATPRERQTALFSATMPGRIAAIGAKHLKNPSRITIAGEKTAAGKMPRVRQVAYVVSRAHKPLALGRVLEIESPSSAIVFCRTRLEVDELVETLSAHGYRAEALHGGMAQKQRDRVMGLFRAQKADLLIATDVAARGLDIEHLSHVVNYDVPSAPEAYVHRIGRTGRVGRAGVAITLAEPREHRLLRNIEAFTKQKIETQQVPTVADLRSRRLELMQASLRERLVAGDFDDVRVVVESLAGEFDSSRSRRRPSRSRCRPTAAPTRRTCRRWRSRRRSSATARVARSGPAAASGARKGTARSRGRTAPSAATWSGCSSAPDAPRECGRATSSVPSPARRASTRAPSAPSKSATGSRSSRYRRSWRRRSSSPCARRRSAAGR